MADSDVELKPLIINDIPFVRTKSLKPIEVIDVSSDSEPEDIEIVDFELNQFFMLQEVENLKSDPNALFKKSPSSEERESAVVPNGLSNGFVQNGLSASGKEPLPAASNDSDPHSPDSAVARTETCAESPDVNVAAITSGLSSQTHHSLDSANGMNQPNQTEQFLPRKGAQSLLSARSASTTNGIADSGSSVLPESTACAESASSVPVDNATTGITSDPSSGLSSNAITSNTSATASSNPIPSGVFLNSIPTTLEWKANVGTSADSAQYVPHVVRQMITESKNGDPASVNALNIIKANNGSIYTAVKGEDGKPMKVYQVMQCGASKSTVNADAQTLEVIPCDAHKTRLTNSKKRQIKADPDFVSPQKARTANHSGAFMLNGIASSNHPSLRCLPYGQPVLQPKRNVVSGRPPSSTSSINYGASGSKRVPKIFESVAAFCPNLIASPTIRQNPKNKAHHDHLINKVSACPNPPLGLGKQPAPRVSFKQNSGISIINKQQTAPATNISSHTNTIDIAANAAFQNIDARPKPDTSRQLTNNNHSARIIPITKAPRVFKRKREPLINPSYEASYQARASSLANYAARTTPISMEAIIEKTKQSAPPSLGNKVDLYGPINESPEPEPEEQKNSFDSVPDEEEASILQPPEPVPLNESAHEMIANIIARNSQLNLIARQNGTNNSTSALNDSARKTIADALAISNQPDPKETSTNNSANSVSPKQSTSRLTTTPTKVLVAVAHRQGTIAPVSSQIPFGIISNSVQSNRPLLINQSGTPVLLNQLGHPVPNVTFQNQMGVSNPIIQVSPPVLFSQLGRTVYRQTTPNAAEPVGTPTLANQLALPVNMAAQSCSGQPNRFISVSQANTSVLVNQLNRPVAPSVLVRSPPPNQKIRFNSSTPTNSSELLNLLVRPPMTTYHSNSSNESGTSVLVNQLARPVSATTRSGQPNQVAVVRPVNRSANNMPPNQYLTINSAPQIQPVVPHLINGKDPLASDNQKRPKIIFKRKVAREKRETQEVQEKAASNEQPENAENPVQANGVDQSGSSSILESTNFPGSNATPILGPDSISDVNQSDLSSILEPTNPIVFDSADNQNQFETINFDPAGIQVKTEVEESCTPISNYVKSPPMKIGTRFSTRLENSIKKRNYYSNNKKPTIITPGPVRIKAEPKGIGSSSSTSQPSMTSSTITRSHTSKNPNVKIIPNTFLPPAKPVKPRIMNIDTPNGRSISPITRSNIKTENPVSQILTIAPSTITTSTVTMTRSATAGQQGFGQIHISRPNIKIETFDDTKRPLDDSAKSNNTKRLNPLLKVYRFKCTYQGCTYQGNQQINVMSHVRKVHFKVPYTLKEQREKGIFDPQNVKDFVHPI